MQKQLLLAAAVIIAASLIAMPLAQEADAQKKDKKVKPQKCNNVKVNVQVEGAEIDDVLIGAATVGGVTLAKTVTVENDTEATGIPFNFKKMSPCPAIGSQVFGDVNGTGFTTELKSLKKPTKVSVSLN